MPPGRRRSWRRSRHPARRSGRCYDNSMFRRARTTGGAPGPGRLIVGLARSHGTGSRKANGRRYSPSHGPLPNGRVVNSRHGLPTTRISLSRNQPCSGYSSGRDWSGASRYPYLPATSTAIKNDPASAVGDRCFLLPRCGMGLLLHGDGDGRLLPARPSLETAIRYDIGIVDRGGPGCCRLDGHDRRSGRGPDQASL